MPPLGSDDYKQFLQKYHCRKGHEYTHTSIANPKTSLYVSEEDYEEFMEQYKGFMVKGVAMHLTEKPKDPSLVRVDLDFRFPLPEEKTVTLPRMYTEYHIQNIVKWYCQIMLQYLDVQDETDMISYVLEKPEPVEYKGKIKDGLHIIFPHLMVPNSFQHFVRRKILEEAPKVLEGIPSTNMYESIVDEAIIDKNNWQMYGSCKPDCSTYRITRIYKYLFEKKELEVLHAPSAQEEIQAVSLLSMRRMGSCIPYLPEKVEEIDEYVRVILPMTLNRRKDKLHQQIFGNTINLTRTHVSDEELEMVNKLVKCLNKSRAENYEDWIKVGWTLRNIDNRLLKSWIEFSQISSKYVSGECEKLWDKMKLDTLGIGSLHYWAKHDNPSEYLNISNHNVITLIDRCIVGKGAHFDVARVVHAMYKHQYRFTTKDIWYTFREDKHRWMRSKEGLQLRMILSCEVCTKFLERATYWNQQSILDQENQDKFQEKAKVLQEIALKLKSSGYKDSVMKECKAQFCDEKFEELLDAHAHLIGFENGVYDLRLHEFREGIPDDYISFSTGRNYMPYNPNAAEVKEINEFLGKVFTNPAICKYVKDIFSSTIDGGIRHEKFYIFTGSGSNGKSRILELVQKIMGEYYCILPIALLTQKRAASNSAQAELERTRGRRFAIMQEPSEGEKINIGLMKELSGGDRIQCRGLFKEPIEFKPQFKMIMTCNDKPEVPSDDGGTWRRIRVVDFCSKFKEDPDPNNPNEFYMDTELPDKFDRWADMFMSMLIENHKNTDLRNIQEPMEVRIATESYKKNNDIVGQYIEEKMQKDDTSTEKVMLQSAFTDFKVWAYQNAPKGKKIPDRNQLRAYMERLFGAYPADGKGWRGVRYVRETKEEEEVE
jgi:P4 family phage/plasmid primase-like protien